MKYLTVSLTKNESTAESDIIKRVSVSGTAGRFGIPNVTIAIPATNLALSHTAESCLVWMTRSALAP